MSWDRTVSRLQAIEVAMKNDNLTDKMVVGLLVHVQEFVRSSGINQDFMSLENDDLIRLAKSMGISGTAPQNHP